jgi:hypothetical protein
VNPRNEPCNAMNGYADSRLMVLNFVVLILLLFSWTAAAFQFPKIRFVGVFANEGSDAPWILVQKGPDEINNLRQKVEKYCGVSIDKDSSNLSSNSVSFRWDPHIRESYMVADAIFQEIAQVSRERHANNDQHTRAMKNQLVLSFPSMARPEDLVKVSEILQSEKCKQLLGLESACADLFPSSPAPYLRIKFSTSIERSQELDDQRVSDVDTPAASARSATNNWINNFLGKYRLCPYTSSVTRAAVGLSSVGVPVGGVHVRVASTNTENSRIRNYNKLKAAELVSSFWSEVVTLMNSTQEQWSTSLVVFPEYDIDFKAFADVCDSIVEPMVVATQSQDFIGRAWFHPKYDADAIGHSEVIAGHAVPHKMVEGFMKSLHSTSGFNGQGLTDYKLLSQANNRIRQTPHATINILRRAQLNAAGEYESRLGKKKPKANSIYVRNAIRLSDALSS